MKMMLKFTLLLAILALPGAAFATHLLDVTGVADCEGFEFTATIGWGSSPTADMSWVAVLTDEHGVEVANISGASVVPRPTTPVTESGLWGLELCGTYTATVSVHLEAISATDGRLDISDDSFTAIVVCECPPDDDSCNYTPGYWRNHPENWPVMELSLGGVSYTQAQLIAIINTSVGGDATIILAHHLIAAKLNVLNGSDPSINDAIDQADDLLAMYPLGSNPRGAARGEILDVKDELVGYNELGCGEEEMGDLEGSLLKVLPDETESSWGQLKANYR